MSRSTGRPQPLVATCDEHLLDDLLRLAAATGVELEVAHDAGTARGRWAHAPLVVIGDDMSAALARLAPTRRSDVLLVGQDPEDADVWRRGVSLGVDEVVFLPDAESHLADRLADAAEERRAPPAVIGVIGGCGGAGASVLATGVALAGARRGADTLLLDLDPLGGGLDLTVGIENHGGLRWPDLAGTRGRMNTAVLREELPRVDGLAVLSWDRGQLQEVSSEAVRAVVAAGQRSHDLVVMDLPRRLDPALEDAVRFLDTALLVLPGATRAVASADRVARSLASVVVDVRLVLRHPRRQRPDDVRIGTALGLPVAAVMEDEAKLDERLEDGQGPCPVQGRGAFARACEHLLDEMITPRQRAA